MDTKWDHFINDTYIYTDLFATCTPLFNSESSSNVPPLLLRKSKWHLVRKVSIVAHFKIGPKVIQHPGT